MTIWFNRAPGEAYPVCMHHPDDETCLVVGDFSPDWVRVPADFPGELAGAVKRVLDVRLFPCPLCQNQEEKVCYVLEDGLLVSECLHHGFVFFKKVDHDAKKEGEDLPAPPEPG